MHKSQGFGAAERRGTWMNDFKLVAGEPATSDLFEGVDSTWKRYGAEGEEVGKILRRVEEGFRADGPGGVGCGPRGSVDGHRAAAGSGCGAPPSPSSPSKKSESSSSSSVSDPLLAAKRAEVVEAIRACLGLWTEAVAAEVSAAPGADVKVATMILNRSSVPATLDKVEVTNAAAPLAGGALVAERARARERDGRAARGRPGHPAVLAARARGQGPLRDPGPHSRRPARERAARSSRDSPSRSPEPRSRSRRPSSSGAPTRSRARSIARSRSSRPSPRTSTKRSTRSGAARRRPSA